MARCTFFRAITKIICGGNRAVVPPLPLPEDDPLPVAVEKAPAPVAPRASTPAADKRLNPIKLRQMKERRRAIEDEVTRLEVEIADYEQALANFKSAEESVRVSDLLNARRADLASLLAEWEEVAQAIEANR